MTKPNCDKPQASRKGRRPKNGVAMSPAERKRQQRRRERQKKTELPSWLRMRREIWQIVQDRYGSQNAHELANALGAVATAIRTAAIWRQMEMSRENSIAPIAAMFNPAEADMELLEMFHDELGSYEPFDELPGLRQVKFAELLRDLFFSHELEASQ